MSSALVNKTTHKVRKDHTKWDCDTCDEINIMKDEICVKCNESRLGQSRALTYTKGCDSWFLVLEMEKPDVLMADMGS
ncbi:hypothetical protein FPSE_06905 [Fusarium pseudograminearum CS3096]|uniref:RanBP2-type domain-containing protein n=1 Tax=Fusarium pseudograminearum (strain CS3096) TaxID=1028729 RepID=K3VFV0_FUSPC|nr:hypothetical protein FPSE_06905 [Fusarium pseudograminearum CS3096]EKJ72859.1 hypothetical protein FPSE_06905 [Fusarium pseudograminearum CS3096]